MATFGIPVTSHRRVHDSIFTNITSLAFTLCTRISDPKERGMRQPLIRYLQKYRASYLHESFCEVALQTFHILPLNV